MGYVFKIIMTKMTFFTEELRDVTNLNSRKQRPAIVLKMRKVTDG